MPMVEINEPRSVFCQAEGNMFQARLNDAAIVLCETLRTAGITHGIFGGFAVHALGGQRESKDVDFLATGSKEEVIEAMKTQPSFALIPQQRQDFVAFLWMEKGLEMNESGRPFPILVKIFVDKFPGVRCSMKGAKTQQVSIQGHTRGRGSISILDPVLVFKGKLEACANRGLVSDLIDLQQLALLYGPLIRQYSAEFAPQTVRLALNRYNELRHVFIGLGLGVAKAPRNNKQFAGARLSAPAAGAVQRSLLDTSRSGFMPFHSITFRPSAYRSPTFSIPTPSSVSTAG